MTNYLPFLLQKSNSLERIIRGEYINERIKKRLKIRNKFNFEQECKEVFKGSFPDPQELQKLKTKYDIKEED